MSIVNLQKIISAREEQYNNTNYSNENDETNFKNIYKLFDALFKYLESFEKNVIKELEELKKISKKTQELYQKQTSYQSDKLNSDTSDLLQSESEVT